MVNDDDNSSGSGDEHERKQKTGGSKTTKKDGTSQEKASLTEFETPDFPPPSTDDRPSLNDPLTNNKPDNEEDELPLTRSTAKTSLLGKNNQSNRVLECLKYYLPRNTTEFTSLMWVLGQYAGAGLACISGLENVGETMAVVVGTPVVFSVTGGIVYYCCYGHNPQVRDAKTNPTRPTYPAMAFGGTAIGISTPLPAVMSAVAHDTTHAVAALALFVANAAGNTIGGLAGWFFGAIHARERLSCGPCCGGAPES